MDKLAIEHMDFQDDLSGVLVSAADGSAIMGVNWNHHPNRRRFTIAHEIGHFVHHSVKHVRRQHVCEITWPALRLRSEGSGTAGESVRGCSPVL